MIIQFSITVSLNVNDYDNLCFYIELMINLVGKLKEHNVKLVKFQEPFVSMQFDR